MLAGRLEEAHALAERALTLTRMHQERGNEAYALCLLGDIAARRDPPESEPAIAHYQHAITWPRNSACARCRPIVTWASAPCTPRLASGSRPVLHCPWPL